MELLNVYRQHGFIEFKAEFDKIHHNHEKINDLMLDASRNGYLDVIKFLFKKRSRMYDTKNPFILAAQEGHLNVVKFLINKVKKRNYSYMWLDTALNEAAEQGHLEVIIFLLENGASNSYHVPLQRAARNGHLDVVKFFVENGAEIRIDNHAPITTAVMNDHLDVVKYLTGKYDNFYMKNRLLELACQCNRFDIAVFLVEKGANIHVNHELCLRRSSEFGYLDIVKFLVEKGADIHTNNDEAYNLACIKGRFEIVKFLIENGCIPNNIPVLIEHKQIEIAKYLKEYTAQQDIERCFENKERWVDGCKHPKKIVLRCCFKMICEDCYHRHWKCQFCDKYIYGKIAI